MLDHLGDPCRPLEGLLVRLRARWRGAPPSGRSGATAQPLLPLVRRSASLRPRYESFWVVRFLSELPPRPPLGFVANTWDPLRCKILPQHPLMWAARSYHLAGYVLCESSELAHRGNRSSELGAAGTMGPYLLTRTTLLRRAHALYIMHDSAISIHHAHTLFPLIL